MRDMIDQLECDKVGTVMKEENDENAKHQINKIKKKTHTKVKQKEAQIVKQDKEIINLKDELASLKLKNT